MRGLWMNPVLTAAFGFHYFVPSFNPVVSMEGRKEEGRKEGGKDRNLVGCMAGHADPWIQIDSAGFRLTNTCTESDMSQIRNETRR